ncbi:MAG TPA: carboxypeptidase-like regulatory domain-containing protein, partial [Gemmatirosa sp.]|nr:carboxypeptidase-like regulatory domain-containing protein [Gemmatirosa sp.]
MSRPSAARAPRRLRLALAILPLLGLGPLAAGAGAQARPRPGTLPGQAPTRPARPDTAPTRRGGAPPRPDAAPAPVAATGRVTLRGIVWDSLANAPLAGAVVQVASAADPSNAFTVQSDSLGEYRLRGLVPGRYLAGFFHRTLDVLGMEARPV